jgi:hypothetical protein
MKKSFHAGWDHFTPAPGTKDKMFCRVCKCEMDVKRNVMGPTGWAEAISRKEHAHDTFSCAHAQEYWHNQARILLERIEKESSHTIATILKKEVKEVIKTKKTTRKLPWEYL